MIIIFTYRGFLRVARAKACSHEIKKIPYQEVVATDALRNSLLIPRVGRSVIPVLFTPEDETLQDSTLIRDVFEQRLPEPSVYPAGPKQRLVALLLAAYDDEWLRMPAMYYRWSFPQANSDFLYAEFERNFAPTLQPSQQREAGEKYATLLRTRLLVF